ncbi:MAG: P4 alpha zinc-binding domain-containing protein [Ahrensia sp.]|nr:P4 alpha zinc-binding domain-containing protein [Ahrensia sp.]
MRDAKFEAYQALVDAFIDDARQVSPIQFYNNGGTGVTLKRSGQEMVGPCPVVGGTDGFAIHRTKWLWNSRRGGIGGKTAIGLAAFCLGVDVTTRQGLLAACAAVNGRPAPTLDDVKAETPEQKQQRLDAMAARRAKAEAERQAEEAAQEAEREKQRRAAVRIVEEATPCSDLSVRQKRVLLVVGDYLSHRIGGNNIPNLKFNCFFGNPDLCFWHDGKVIYRGPAMVLPFLNRSGTIGCHITWIDLNNAPKFRPLLLDGKGVVLPTKKIRGQHAGGILPVVGVSTQARWVVGEGIENTFAVAYAEEFRDDTFYAAAGTLGNMAGPADPDCSFKHPVDTFVGRDGIARACSVPGCIPLAGSDDRAMPVPSHVESLVLLADADSERVFTASAMARAKRRFETPNRKVTIVWPQKGFGDFSDWMKSGAVTQNQELIGGAHDE